MDGKVTSNLFIAVIKGVNIVFIKTTEKLLNTLYNCYVPYGCKVISSNEDEYTKGLEDDLSFDVTDIRTIEEILE